MESDILGLLAKKNYTPLTPKRFAERLGLAKSQFGEFRRVLRELLKQGRVELGKNQTVRPGREKGTLVGLYRRNAGGRGSVRLAGSGDTAHDIRIDADDAHDAAPGDEVVVRVRRRGGPGKPSAGEIVKVLTRASTHFVGTYFERDGQGLVRVNGTGFQRSIAVGDPGAKGAKPDDQVVLEMVRYPTPHARGEGVITEVLGARGTPGVDTLAIIHEFNLPDAFPEDVLAEARLRAAEFDPDDLNGREDFTNDLVITIDPVDARDFDDAVSLERDASGHWRLTVHIADVGHFAAPGSALDLEAKKRGTSVYLPGRVLPMFPEIISNNLASLQADKNRYVKTAVMDFDPHGVPTAARFANGVICVKRRFAYEQVSALLFGKLGAPEVSPEIRALLERMKELALILRGRRKKRGSLDLQMPEVKLDYDEQGRVNGGHFAEHDISHQMIEECMLAANEAVATHFGRLEVPFLRRIHPAPDPHKLEAFADFARHLGYKIKRGNDRFALQRVLDESATKPNVAAVHYAMLRSLKQATYGPEEDEHFALASPNYCHFTSPIRRYPDLTVHRLLDRWLKTKKATSDLGELTALGVHCSQKERRAEAAERELVKTKLLSHFAERIGLELDAVITGVAEYGFFAQGVQLPAEGLVHVRTLNDDYYVYDGITHTLMGQNSMRRFRLGDTVTVKVAKVDVGKRSLDFELVRKKKVPKPA